MKYAFVVILLLAGCRTQKEEPKAPPTESPKTQSASTWVDHDPSTMGQTQALIWYNHTPVNPWTPIRSPRTIALAVEGQPILCRAVLDSVMGTPLPTSKMQCLRTPVTTKVLCIQLGLKTFFGFAAAGKGHLYPLGFTDWSGRQLKACAGQPLLSDGTPPGKMPPLGNNHSPQSDDVRKLL